MAHIYSPKIVSDSMVLCVDAANPRSYPGSGTSWSDLTGNRNDFSMSSMTYDSGDAGSFLFDGSTSRATGPSIDLGQYGTLNVWFRQSLETVNKGLFGITDGIGYTFFYIGGASSTRISIWNYGSSVPQYSSEVAIPADRKTSWNMATYTWAESTVSVAINADAPVTTSGYSFTRSGAAYIGVYPTLASSFNGYISCVQLYSRALTQAEVSANYAAMLPRYL